MDIMALMGLGVLILLILMFIFLVSDKLAFILYPEAFNEFKKLKNEIISGKARAIYRSSSPACHTRCEFQYSSGVFKTHLDPVSSPFGVYDVEYTDLQLSDFDMDWLGRKAHSFAQKNNLTQRGKIKGLI